MISDCGVPDNGPSDLDPPRQAFSQDGYFGYGTTVVRRDVHRTGWIGAVESARVVRDDARGLLTWTAAGSQIMSRTTLTGAPIRKLPLAVRDVTPTMLSPDQWRDTSVLMLTEPRQNHSTWWFFGLEGAFLGWYVNLETPGRRWPGGLDITDHALDIWVEPDRTWHWKDEDELAERTGHPHYWSAREAEAIRAAGRGIVPKIEAGTFPFDGSLTTYRPDPGWKPTTLPPNWDDPPIL